MVGMRSLRTGNRLITSSAPQELAPDLLELLLRIAYYLAGTAYISL